jgi:hypothetical protein
LKLINSKSNLSKPTAALFLLSLATACGGSNGDDAHAGSDASNGGASAIGGASGAGGHGASGGHANAGGSTGSGGATAGAGGAPPESDAATTLELPVELGTAGKYVVLAKSGISTVPTSAITGNLGMSPAAATYVTGFSLTMDATKAFSTTTQVTGKVYAADYASPTGANLTTAVGDMEHAFTDAAGRAPDVTELGAGNIGGMTLAPGVYKWGTGVLIPSDVTLKGDGTAVWIFQIAQTLTVSSAVHVVLSGGALPKNVFWQVSGKVELGTTAQFEGVILSKTSITLRTGASIGGRLLSQTAVNIDSSTLTQPAP